MSFDAVPDPAVRRYLDSRRNWIGLLLAATFTAITWPTTAETHDIAAFLLPVFAAGSAWSLAFVFAGPRAVRVGWAMVTVTAAVASLFPASNAPMPMPIPMFITLLVMTFAGLLTQPLDKVPVLTLITAGAFVVGLTPDMRIGWIFALVVVAIGTSFVRYRMSAQKVIAERSVVAEHAQAREAVLAERARIARELHDVVAHRMSMVVVMSQTAKYRLAAADPAETIGPGADAEFTAIADAARQSLDEVRQLLGVLRPSDGDADVELTPMQGVDDLPELVASARAAGVDIDFADRVDRWGDPGAAGAAAYRIVQESVTNAARHAPGAQVVVRLDRDGADVIVSIVNGPAVAEPDGAGSGHGLVGMNERASAVGGELTHGPTSDGGFAVTARIPLPTR
ncbi:two-component sensor histidine kinase [Gordonia spumicola]|uniref:histidine kinase n=1 Tax=Gordonia spumicola TaxID=589161 RepID=A0A7I9VER6_9ACTN|nr:two-component sensor histidine kinase [Gordonia spumicola]